MKHLAYCLAQSSSEQMIHTHTHTPPRVDPYQLLSILVRLDDSPNQPVEPITSTWGEEVTGET